MAIPSMQTFNYRLEELSVGRAVMVAPYDSKLDGIFACFHGGLLATLADSTGGAAALTMIGADAATATTDVSVRFIAPCRTDARATATIIHAGGRLVIAGVDIHDTNGKLVAVGQVSYMRLKR